MKQRWILGVLVATSACGSGATALTGAIDGKSLQAHYAISTYVNNVPNGAQPPDILMSTRSDMCTLLQKGQFARSTDVVDIQLFDNTTATNAPTSAGVFSIVEIPNTPSNPDMYAVVQVGTTADSNTCLNANYSAATQGSVTITELGDTTRPTLGNFDTTFPNGKLSGYFFAVPCLISDAAANGSVACEL